MTNILLRYIIILNREKDSLRDPTVKAEEEWPVMGILGYIVVFALGAMFGFGICALFVYAATDAEQDKEALERKNQEKKTES